LLARLVDCELRISSISFSVAIFSISFSVIIYTPHVVTMFVFPSRRWRSLYEARCILLGIHLLDIEWLDAHVLVFPLWEVGILCDAIQVFFYLVILDKVMDVIEGDDRHEMRTKTLVLLSVLYTKVTIVSPLAPACTK
jgi:hypothetical protein